MRTSLRLPAVALAVLALVATACGGGNQPAGDETTAPTTDATGTAAASIPEDGPTITVASFDFPESTLLAEIYAGALEASGFPVQRELNLGTRELIFPELRSANIDLLPEYVGSALSVGFGGEATADLQESVSRLRDQFENVTVLEPTDAQNQNVFVVTQEFADANGVEAISDLADVEGEVTFGGRPECEERETCLIGLQETYGLDNLSFEAIQQNSVRAQSLANGEIDMAALFSTDPIIAEEGFAVLEDDQGITPVENIVPVLSNEVVDAYGDVLTARVEEIGAPLTTEVLLELNGRVQLDQEDPAEVAQSYLEEQGLLGG